MASRIRFGATIYDWGSPFIYGDFIIQEIGGLQLFRVAWPGADATGNDIFWQFSPNGKYLAACVAYGNTSGDIYVFDLGTDALSSSDLFDATTGTYNITPSLVTSLTGIDLTQPFGGTDVACITVTDSGDFYWCIDFTIAVDGGNTNNYWYLQKVSLGGGALSNYGDNQPVYNSEFNPTARLEAPQHFWPGPSEEMQVYCRILNETFDGTLFAIYSFVSSTSIKESEGVLTGGFFTDSFHPAFQAGKYNTVPSESSGNVDLLLWTLDKTESSIVVSTLPGNGDIDYASLGPNFSDTIHVFGIGNMKVFSQSDTTGFFEIDNQTNVDGRPRIYQLTGALGGSFSKSGTPYAGISPGYDDDSVVKVWDLFSLPSVQSENAIALSIFEAEVPPPSGGGRKAIFFVVQ